MLKEDLKKAVLEHMEIYEDHKKKVLKEQFDEESSVSSYWLIVDLIGDTKLLYTALGTKDTKRIHVTRVHITKDMLEVFN